MKKGLLASTACLGAGVISASAFAADGIRLGISGFFHQNLMVVFDDDREGELGNERNTDGFFNDAEVHFTGATVLDNGLAVGARVELEGETGNDQIDEAWVYFMGGQHEARIGSQDDALVGACVLPPGGTDFFSAFSPNQWGANTDLFASDFPALTSNAACLGVDEHEDVQRLVYLATPFDGFELRLSYAPNGGDETHDEGVGPHVGMPVNADGESRHNVAAYVSYLYEGEDWGFNAGAGGSFEGHVEQQPGPDRDEQQFYQAAATLTLGTISFGAVFEYFDNLATLDDGDAVDAWVAGGGIGYETGRWVLGAQYSHQLAELKDGSDDQFTMDRAIATFDYEIAGGVNIESEAAYTWLDTEPETAGDLDDYQAIELALGTTLRF